MKPSETLTEIFSRSFIVDSSNSFYISTMKSAKTHCASRDNAPLGTGEGVQA